MPAFMPLKAIMPLSAIGRTVAIHSLKPVYLHIFLMIFSLCYKGKHYKKMTAINYHGIIGELDRIYGIKVSRHQIKRAVAKFVSLGLLEVKTAKFGKLVGTQYLPTTTVYMRLYTQS